MGRWSDHCLPLASVHRIRGRPWDGRLWGARTRTTVSPGWHCNMKTEAGVAISPKLWQGKLTFTRKKDSSCPEREVLVRSSEPPTPRCRFIWGAFCGGWRRKQKKAGRAFGLWPESNAIKGEQAARSGSTGLGGNRLAPGALGALLSSVLVWEQPKWGECLRGARPWHVLGRKVQ